MKLDTRQVRQNVKLDQLGTALNVRLDTALNLINDEITLPLRMIASDTPNLVLNIGPISIKTVDESISPNIGHGRTRTVPPINGVLPVFTGATVTFPSASGGSISSSVTLVGGPYTLTVASGNWIKVGISLTETGGIYLTFGTAAATEAAAGLPDFNTGYFPVGYVSLQNVGGTIQTVTNARIYQFIGGGTGGGGGSSIDRVSQAAHGFVVGDLLYLNGSTYAKASAAAGNTAEIVGIVSKITSSSAFELTLLGEVSGLLASSFDSGVLPATGDTVFLSATAGKLTVTEPSVVGQVSLPVGVMSTANSVYFKPSRGVVIGGANVRTQIGLANAATTTIQNASAYSAGELSGWVFIDATTDLRFYIQAQFAKNGAGTDYNLSYQTTGDTPPAGFNVTITSAGVIQVTLPSISGYSTASINFALNAPAVGATLPLSIDSSNVSFSDIKAASSAGITFKEDGGNTTMVITDAGSVGIGTASPISKLDIKGSVPAGAVDISVRNDSTTGFSGIGCFEGSVAKAQIWAGNSQYLTYGGAGSLNYSANSGPHVWHTNYVERMRIDASGNVGIGTVSPASTVVLDIKEPDAGQDLILGLTAGTGARAQIRSIAQPDNTSSALSFATTSGGATGERMRIDASGRFMVGATSSDYIFRANGFSHFGDAYDTGLYGAVQISRPQATSNKFHLACISSGLQVCGLGFLNNSNTFAVNNASSSNSNGVSLATGGTSWSPLSSDIRKKKNFETTQGLAEVLQIEPVKYHLLDDEDTQSKRLGFKAQNLQPLIPEMVIPNGQKAEDGSDYLTITPDYILPVLVKAIQEQQALIEKLEARIAALETK